LLGCLPITTSRGGWTTTSTYFYNASGLLDSLAWQRANSTGGQGSEKYFYEGTRLVKQINRQVGLVDEVVDYTYGDGRIEVATFSNNGVKNLYIFYEYDAAGRLSKSETYVRHASGYYYDRKSEKVFTYHSNGNLNEVKQYEFNAETASLTWLGTRAYTDYFPTNAIFDFEVTVPGIRLQNQLPKTVVDQDPSASQSCEYNFDITDAGYLRGYSIRSSNGNEERTTIEYHQ